MALILSALVFSLASNLDNVVVGISYNYLGSIFCNPEQNKTCK